MTKKQKTASWQEYARAESFLPWNANPKIFKARVTPHWILPSDDGPAAQFWYLNKTRNGNEFILVDAENRERRRAFDHDRLASALSAASGKPLEGSKLPFETIDWVEGGRCVRFSAVGLYWSCDLETYQCNPYAAPEHPNPLERVSPDGRHTVWKQGHDLYLKDNESGNQTRLTEDGEPYYDYASTPEGNLNIVTFRRRNIQFPPVAVWSPDSRYVVTHRLDQRHVKELHLLQMAPEDGSARPVLHTFRYPLFADEHIPLAELIVFDVESGKRVDVQHPGMNANVFSPIEFRWVWWSQDSRRLYFIDKNRRQTVLELHECDPETGAVRKILQERSETKIVPNLWLVGLPNVHELDESREITWFSERDGWGHLYLYDRMSGTLKRQLTSGAWAVRDVVHVDNDERWVYFIAGGREAGREPFFRHFYRVQVDTGEVQLLTPEDADHDISLSPDRRYFLDTYGTIDTPAISVLRRIDSTLVMQLEQADYSALDEMGWRRPEPFNVKAEDGITDLYGALYFPTDFDPNKRYPVIDSIYGGTQMLRVHKSYPHPEDTINLYDFWMPQAVAELGFIVFVFDARGRPFRSKAFLDYADCRAQDMGGLLDHIAGMRQLAAQRPYMDLSRVGIFGLSAGGYNSARALLEFPDFFHVGVAAAGPHDYRVYMPLFGERSGGFEDLQRLGVNSTLAGNLKGKLLLTHGELDDNVHPASTWKLVDALIQADKDFDLLIMPNHNHSCDLNAYYTRRLWNYFVEHLQGRTPPDGYHIQPPTGLFSKDSYMTPPVEHEE